VRQAVRFGSVLGLCGTNTLHKTVSTTFFLYFACILPSIALGVLNYNNTGGMIGTLLENRMSAHLYIDLVHEPAFCFRPALLLGSCRCA